MIYWIHTRSIVRGISTFPPRSRKRFRHLCPYRSKGVNLSFQVLSCCWDQHGDAVSPLRPRLFTPKVLEFTRQEWETQHQAVFQDGPVVSYQSYEAIYWAAGDSIAPSAPIVTLRIYGGKPETINAEVQRFLRADAQYTKTIQGQSGDGPLKVRVYTSDSLRARYTPLTVKGIEWLPWGSDPPGIIKDDEIDRATAGCHHCGPCAPG